MFGEITLESVLPFLRVLFLLFVGLPLCVGAGKLIKSFVARRFSAQQGMIAGKVVQYGGIALVLISVLNQLGFSLAPLLGAAGIVGVALGFASQTSVSNVISGIFLIAERPFQVGDLITIGDVTGTVLSVDVLSVKIRAFDNRYIRIPNETIIKSQVTNITRFPIRRIDILVSVAYKEDIRRVREVLLDVAHTHPLCLIEPAPLVIFNGFGSSSIDLLFAVWCDRNDFLTLKTTIQEQVKERFEAEGIEIPFPHLSLYSGLATEPLPIRLVNSDIPSPDAGKTS